MLRHAAQLKRPVQLLRSQRWMNATTKQKRALKKSQLQGSAAAATQASDKTAAPPVPPSDGGGSSNSSLVPLGLAGLAAAGGAVYYYSTLDVAVEEEAVKEKEMPKEESTESKGDEKEETNEPKSMAALSSVAFPAKMRNTVAPEIVVQAHPEQGNKVGLVGSKSKPPKDDATMTTRALSQLQKQTNQNSAQALRDSHQSAWSELQTDYLQDLDTQSPAQLQARLVQLATELKDRTKWEAVRLQELLALKEKETSDRYMELMQKQRLEFEDLLAQRLRERDDQHAVHLRQALVDKDTAVQSLLNSALQVQAEEHAADMETLEQVTQQEIKNKLDAEYGAKMTEYTDKVTAELQQKTETLQQLEQQLQRLESALSKTTSLQEGSVRAHKLSAAALALAEQLETSQPAISQIQALQQVAGSSGVIATALATIPEQDKGVPTLPELQARFAQVHKKARQAALVPSGTSSNPLLNLGQGLEGQLAGMVLATVKYAPDDDAAAPEDEKDNAEYVLARAKHHVQVGDLEAAVEQLEKLQGQVAFTVQDWKKNALHRVAVTKALKVIKMECALLNESLVQD